MRKLFSSNPDLDIWVYGVAAYADSKILFTISNPDGTKSVLITPSTIAESDAKYFVETPPERVITPNQIRIKRIQSSLKFIGYILSAVILTFAVLSTTGMVKARVVLTGSMSPTINPGDIVLLAAPNKIEPKVGEITAYTGRRFSGEAVGLFTHRIIGGNSSDGFIMKGDGNAAPDVQRPKLNDINGVVFFVIPFIGKLLSTKVLTALIPVIIGIWFIVDALREQND